MAAGTGHGPLGLTLPGPDRTLLLWRLQVQLLGEQETTGRALSSLHVQRVRFPLFEEAGHTLGQGQCGGPAHVLGTGEKGHLGSL